MSSEVPSGRHLKIDGEADVVIARRAVRALALQHGLDAFATAALTTAVAELARNMWVHAGGGNATIREVSDAGRVGIRVDFRDEGPGIPDVARALAGAECAVRGLGLGLPGSRRMVDELEVDSNAGRGTVVTIVKWRRS